MNRLCTILLLALATALTTGCPIVLTCEDLGCDRGEVCNAESGECEEVVRDCRTEDICRSSEVCDEETGECRPERLRCTQTFTCPEGQSCNATDGFCEPAFRCESASDCGLAEQCNTASQQCEPRECDGDADCPAAYVCDGDSECAPGCRPGADGCLDRQFCEVPPGESIGTCVPNCRVDGDCPFGQSCDLSTGPDSRCVSEGPCSVDADCRVDESCVDGACVQPPCRSDGDCLESQICQTSTRTCQAAECVEDNFGAAVPNHSRQTAFKLGVGNYTQLSLCPGRSDWFALDARGTDLVRLRLSHQTPQPDLDIYVFDEDGKLLLQNQDVAVVSSLKFGAGRTQTLYIEVRSTGFDGANYDLTISTEVCPNDTFEENDTLAEATVVPSSIGVPTELALRACGFDEDWFRVRQNDANNGLRVARVSGTSDLSVEVFTPDGGRFDVSTSQPLHMLRAGAVGSVYVRARGATGRTGDYRLAFEVLDQWTCPERGAHSIPADALPATPDAVVLETFCPLDGGWEVDWIALDVPISGLLDAQVRPTGNSPPLEVVLFSGDATDTQLVRAAAIVNDVAFVQASVDPQTQWFLRVSSSAGLGRIVADPAYELEYIIR